jgi:hypothetical protein
LVSVILPEWEGLIRLDWSALEPTVPDWVLELGQGLIRQELLSARPMVSADWSEASDRA